MSIRIGEDGAILSSEGEIPQDRGTYIEEDGSIRMDNQPVSIPTSPRVNVRRPPVSPLQFSRGADNVPVQPAYSTTDAALNTESVGARSENVIEYELQVKRAEQHKALSPLPLIAFAASALLAIFTLSPVPLIFSAIATVFIVRDVMKRSDIAKVVRGLELELESVRAKGNR